MRLGVNIPNFSNYGGPFRVNQLKEAHNPTSTTYSILAAPMQRRPGGVGNNWIVLFDGTGSISFSDGATEQSSSAGRYEVEVDEGSDTAVVSGSFQFTTSGDVTNIRVLPPGGRSDDATPVHTYSPSAGKDYETTYATQVWFPDFLKEIGTFDVARFLNWALANDSVQQRWAERPVTADTIWTSAGVPWETIIDLCNTADVRPWIVIPHLAEDDYITQLATLVRDDFDHTIGAPIFEWSNEVTNTASWSDPTKQAFTAQNTGDTITRSSHGLVAGDSVMVTSIGDTAIGLSEWVRYFVVNPTANTFQVSESEGGSVVAVTADSGTGTYQYVKLPYGQYAYARDRGAALSLGSTDIQNVQRYLSQRTSEMVDLVEAVYSGSGKTYESAAMVSSDSAALVDVLDHQTGGVALSTKVDVGGTHFYFGLGTYTDADLAVDDTVADMIDHLLNETQYDRYAQINGVAKVCADRSLKAYFYEGGHHFFGANQSDARWTDLLETAEFEYFYQHYLNALRFYLETLNGIAEADSVVCHYTGSRGWQGTTRFGIRRHFIDVFTADSPSWRAVGNMISNPGAPTWP